MTLIRRERHRPMWRRPVVLVPVVLVAGAAGLAGAAWHLGAPVAVRPVALALPDTDVGVDSGVASTGTSE